MPCDRDMNPLANELISILLRGNDDLRLKRSRDGGVQFRNCMIFPSAVQATTDQRKKKLHEALNQRLKAIGWFERGTWWNKSPSNRLQPLLS
ncbi:hypothetical protein JP09_009955 [Dehalogenimonas etheniformans]|uniref:Uncharacterized protein n=1 Tax=Dehalogenimonas etheniformans TaxID=1536648 RepID=A0A2P5P4X6_9CHLR|nr:hypothetical protein JP09_009955 [Dehalogenimonas etheniformans]